MASHTPDIEITDQFARALRGMEQGKRHLLITGSAGTGKSTLLGHFCRQVDWDPVVLAPTGVAALNVGGQTVHRFFGFGIDVTPQAIAARRRKPRNARLYKSLRTLIIDEVSMLRADLLDCVDVFLRQHGPVPGAPFGGVHMVFIGDLYQLPPVVTGLEREALRQVYASPHFFCARSLEGIELEMIELTQVFRQRDREFVRLLNRIRKNTLEDGDLDGLNQRVDAHFEPSEGEGYITLTGTNRAAGMINRMRLDGLAVPEHLFEALISGDFSREYYPTEVPALLQGRRPGNDAEQRWRAALGQRQHRQDRGRADRGRRRVHRRSTGRLRAPGTGGAVRMGVDPVRGPGRDYCVQSGGDLHPVPVPPGLGGDRSQEPGKDLQPHDR